MFNCPNVFLFTEITFFTSHLVDSIVGFLIDTIVVVVIDVLGVMIVDPIIHSFIFSIVIIILAIVSYSCMI